MQIFSSGFRYLPLLSKYGQFYSENLSYSHLNSNEALKLGCPFLILKATVLHDLDVFLLQHTRIESMRDKEAFLEHERVNSIIESGVIHPMQELNESIIHTQKKETLKWLYAAHCILFLAFSFKSNNNKITMITLTMIKVSK